MQNLAFINGFRALAALWVVVAHSMIWAGWLGPPLPSAKLAVDLFIIISGYLMMLHAHEREAHEPMAKASTWAKFYVRRLFRIAPTYYVALAAVVVASPVFLGGYAVLHDQHPYMVHEVTYNPKFVEITPYSIFLHVTFLFGLIPKYVFSTFLPDWSLSLEMQFYAVFPMLYLFARRFGWYRMVFYLYFPCHYLIDRVSFMHAPRGGPLFADPSLLPLKLHYFMVGMLIARTGFAGIGRNEKAYMWATAIAISLVDVWSYGAETAIITVMIVAMLYATTFDSSRIRSDLDQLSRRPSIAFMSRMSYPAYLFHGFAISGVGYFILARPELAGWGYQARTLLMVVIVVPSTYALSWLIERYIESPGIALGRVFLRSFPRRVSRREADNLGSARMEGHRVPGTALIDPSTRK